MILVILIFEWQKKAKQFQLQLCFHKKKKIQATHTLSSHNNVSKTHLTSVQNSGQ